MITIPITAAAGATGGGFLGGLIKAAPVLDIGAKILGGIFGKSSAKKQNQMQLAMAREQMQFQERMANTAHQREVQDLRQAGLNPILSANKGAPAPGGAQANIVGEDNVMAQNLGNMLSSAQQIAQIRQQTELLKATTDKEQALARQQNFETDMRQIDWLMKNSQYLEGDLQRKWKAELNKAVADSEIAGYKVPEQKAIADLWKTLSSVNPHADEMTKGINMIMRMYLGGGR